MSTISEVLGRRVQLKGLIGKRAMKCPYCDFYFMKNGSDLQRHIWAHEGELSPFRLQCPLSSVLVCFLWECSGESMSSSLLQLEFIQHTEKCAHPPAMISDLNHYLFSCNCSDGGVQFFITLIAAGAK